MDEEDEQWEDWVSAARTGDAGAWGELVDRLYPRISARIGGMLPRREEVEDLCQDVFHRVVRNLPKYRGGSFPAWVDTIAKRICYDALRKRRVRPEWRFADLGFEPESGYVASAPEDRDAAEVVGKVLEGMRSDQAWLIREVELAGRGIGEISDELGWTRAGGRVRLYRARAAMKEIYLKQHESRND